MLKASIHELLSPFGLVNWFSTLVQLTLLPSDTAGDAEMLPGVTGAMGGHSAWLQGIRSPLIAEESGAEKELKLRFDVSQYSPEEIMVKTVDNKLLVHAKHEESTGGWYAIPQ